MSSKPAETVAAAAPPELRLTVPLAPLREIDRPLSVSEYFFAALGSSGRTLEVPREMVYVLEAESTLQIADWQRALAIATAAHPCVRLRVVGRRRGARWRSDGPPPRLRIVRDCQWDGRSKDGAEFITAEPLSAQHGPVAELLIAEGPAGTRLIVRALHAVMDGRGCLYFIRDLFCALRGETPEGINAAYSDTDLLKQLVAPLRGTRVVKQPGNKSVPLTGPAQGDELGDTWQRLTLHGPQRELTARVVEVMTDYARHSGSGPLLFKVSVDLRRHVPGMVSASMFVGVLPVPMQAGERAADFTQRLNGLIASGAHLLQWSSLAIRLADLMRLLPFGWLDRLVSRNRRNFRSRPVFCTALVSNIGRQDPAIYECPGFRLKAFFAYGEQEAVYCGISGVGEHCELVVGMPRVHASGGRLDAFMRHFAERLGETPSRIAPPA